MSNVLYLVHRLPYPPNKGDKVRSFNILKYISSRHRVFLGSFFDDKEDEQYIARCEKYCVETKIIWLDLWSARIRSLMSVVGENSVSVAYYDNAVLKQWVESILKNHRIDAIVVFSGVMAQFVPWSLIDNRTVVLIDFVDVDSLKWADYAARRRGVSAWFFKNESRKLLSFEKAVAEKADCSFFVTEREAASFQTLAGECQDRVFAIENGVDVDYFEPVWVKKSIFPDVSDKIIVFTGAMDYWPNIDAVQWFVSDILPQLLHNYPSLVFFIVGRNPARSVSSLSGDSVVVTGQVADVRPFLQFADLVVAPLRVARGVQNKILEAMAMQRPIVASAACSEALHPMAQAAISIAQDADGFAAAAIRLLAAPEDAQALGQRARKAVLDCYSWDANLSRFDAFLPSHPQISNEAIF